MGRHPGGAGYIPEGLAPLCIRATEGPYARLVGRWQATHPPLELRVGRLMALAHVSPDDFERQLDAASERFAEREHAVRPPASAAGRPDALAGLAGPGHCRRPRSRALRRVTSAAPVTTGAAMTCPSCGDGLQSADYEGIPLQVCRACGGRLATTDQVRRIAARREVAFSDEQHHLAGLIVDQGDQLRRAALRQRGRAAVPLVPCPKVRHDHDAPPLQLRARCRGRLLQPVRPLLVRKGRARGAAGPARASGHLRGLVQRWLSRGLWTLGGARR